MVVYTREQIQASGRANVGEFLQTIPEQSNAIGRSHQQRRLGLDPRQPARHRAGRRPWSCSTAAGWSPGGTGADDSVDLSAIPTNVIERIEILKDGASAIYGSDAIGGVVNIITRKRLDGGDISVLGGTTSRVDGRHGRRQRHAGHHLRQGQPAGLDRLLPGRRRSGPATATSAQRAARSSTARPAHVDRAGQRHHPQRPHRAARRPRPAWPTATQAWNDLVTANPMASSFIRDRDGTWRPFRGTGLNEDGYNYQPANYLVTPQQRFNVFVTGDYRLGNFARAYVDSFYTKRNSAQTLAPEPLLLDGEGRDGLGRQHLQPVRPRLRRRPPPPDRVRRPRATSRTSTTSTWSPASTAPPRTCSARCAAGSGTVSFNFSQNESTELKTGNVRLTKLRDAVGPSFMDASGAARCGTPAAPIDGCVPLNLFGGARVDQPGPGPGADLQRRAARATIS